MEPDVIDFLQESNYIEGVRDGLDNAVKAWDYISKQPELTKAFILHTHKKLMKGRLPINQLGAWRKGPVWIGGHEAKHWYAIPDLMENWIKMVNGFVDLTAKAPKTMEEKGLPAEETIKQHHIIFEAIHPFWDGNGRMGRILMNWARLKVGLPILIIKEEERFDYYKWFSH